MQNMLRMVLGKHGVPIFIISYIKLERNN